MKAVMRGCVNGGMRTELNMGVGYEPAFSCSNSLYRRDSKTFPRRKNVNIIG